MARISLDGGYTKHTGGHLVTEKTAKLVDANWKEIEASLNKKALDETRGQPGTGNNLGLLIAYLDHPKAKYVQLDLRDDDAKEKSPALEVTEE